MSFGNPWRPIRNDFSASGFMCRLTISTKRNRQVKLIFGLVAGAFAALAAVHANLPMAATTVEIDPRFQPACLSNGGIYDAGGTFYRTDGTVMRIDNSCVTDHSKFQTVTEFLRPLELK